MNKQHILGGLLFVLLAANIFCGGMFIGKQQQPAEKKGTALLLESLPEPQRDQALAAARPYRPQIRDAITNLRKTRQAAFEFVAGNDYDRTKAEDRFKQVREQTTATQEVVHRMVLDIADKLPPELREEVLQHKLDGDKD